jgi:hypothetical protein
MPRLLRKLDDNEKKLISTVEERVKSVRENIKKEILGIISHISVRIDCFVITETKTKIVISPPGSAVLHLSSRKWSHP